MRGVAVPPLPPSPPLPRKAWLNHSWYPQPLLPQGQRPPQARGKKSDRRRAGMAPAKTKAAAKTVAKGSGKTDLPKGSGETDLPKGSGETDLSKSLGSDTPARANDPGSAGAGETAQGSPGGGRKRGGGDVDGIAIPAKALRTETAAPGEISCPELPPDDSTMDAWEVLKDYIPWVKHELAKSAVVRGSGAAKPLWQYAPLGMQVAGAKTQSYMAPWDDGAAVTTLRDTHLYQAGGDVGWLLASVYGPVPVVRMS